MCNINIGEAEKRKTKTKIKIRVKNKATICVAEYNCIKIIKNTVIRK